MLAPEGASTFLLYALAEKLGKTIGETRSLPQAEIDGWFAYFAAKKEINEP